MSRQIKVSVENNEPILLTNFWVLQTFKNQTKYFGFGGKTEYFDPQIEIFKASPRPSAHIMLGTDIQLYRCSLFQPLYTRTRTNLWVTYSVGWYCPLLAKCTN